MTQTHHDIRCAIVRTGNARAWCDCGAEPPVLSSIRTDISEQLQRHAGAIAERNRIAAFVRAQADDIIGQICDGRAEPIEMELVSTALELLADMIEEGPSDEPNDDTDE